MEAREPEIWKPIPDYEGIYEISSWGRVKGMKRLVGYRRKGFLKLISEKILTNHISRGYEFVNLYKENKRDPRRINILVAMVFLEDYDNNKVINHKDQKKLNNYYKNLECVYNRENVTFSVNKNTTSSNYVGAYVSYKTVNGKSYKQIHSEIGILGKKIWLGSFKTEEEAHQAYLDALKERGLTNKYATETQEKS
jgi:hypothetical protein